MEIENFGNHVRSGFRSSADTHMYRTINGNAAFKFGFVWRDRSFEIDVLSMAAAHDFSQVFEDHVVSTDRGTYALDLVRGKEPTTMAEARRIAELWAERIEKAITATISGIKREEAGIEPDKMVFVSDAYESILNTVGTLPAETGGILMGFRDDYIVRKFIFDPSGSRWSTGYDPDIDFLNMCLKNEWSENRYSLLGFIHSHPRGVSRLSGDFGNGYGDVGYLKSIFKNIPALEKFFVPIVFSSNDGGKVKIFPYIATRSNVDNYSLAGLSLVESPVEAHPVHSVTSGHKISNRVSEKEAGNVH